MRGSQQVLALRKLASSGINGRSTSKCHLGKLRGQI